MDQLNKRQKTLHSDCPADSGQISNSTKLLLDADLHQKLCSYDMLISFYVARQRDQIYKLNEQIMSLENIAWCLKYLTEKKHELSNE